MAPTPAAPEGDSTSTKEAASRDEILRSTYQEATKWLREQHASEFNAKRAELAAAQGVEWKPALSEREKAAAALAEILQAHPDLVENLPVVS